jgi:hypothetical protein
VRKRIVRLADMRAHRPGWLKREVSHLHRAANILRQAGLSLETDSGVTDEGEPWFVFCDADSDEVLVHFARISETYIVCSPSLSGSLTGHSLPDLIQTFLIVAVAAPRWHPSAAGPRPAA